MSQMSSISGSPLPSNITFEQCVKELLHICRVADRGFARVIEQFRSFEEEEWKKATREKADSYRSVAPMIAQAASIVFSLSNVAANIAPSPAAYLFQKIQELLPCEKTAVSEIGKSVKDMLNSCNGISKIAHDFFQTRTEARRVDIEATIQKSKELSDRRSKEANENRSDREEFLRLLDQINREIAEGIRLNTHAG